MLELRRDAERIMRRIQAGERLVLTYRGCPVARLEPLSDSLAIADDPFYTLDHLADAEGNSLSNREMDAILYLISKMLQPGEATGQIVVRWSRRRRAVGQAGCRRESAG